ncbi:aspartate 1-decarboxylase [Streptomyces sp. NPDC052301]|uniref:aspartate 1-decarboxylase n=1 Tax=Streptomyces sp. NPDC052301 TaxID=3365687 RepID=UPI0037D08D61
MAHISPIARFTVAQSHLDYVGSITIDADLVEAAGIRRLEKIDLVNVINGAPLPTYIIDGPRPAHRTDHVPALPRPPPHHRHRH